MLRPDYYYQDMAKFYQDCIPVGSSVLELTDYTFSFLKQLQPRRSLSIHIFNQQKLPIIKDKFDYIILPDVINRSSDLQSLIHQLQIVSTPETRIIFNYYNFLWSPLLILAEALGLKTKQAEGNWLSADDIGNLLTLENFEIINLRRRLLFPLEIPIISTALNRYLAHLPGINQLCLNNYLIARSLNLEEKNKVKVSVIVPARNEQGNIVNLVQTIPLMGQQTEIIFVEGHSHDNTAKEIKRLIKKYPKKTISLLRQKRIGKADAVRLGMKAARGDILMIFDADLTVGVEELSKFFSAIVSGKGEFINGSRLVYPMEKQAMRLLNIFGNKFFSLIFSWMLGQRIKDTLCGTKVISRKNYRKILSSGKYFGDFDPFGDFDLIFGAAKHNLKFIEIPIKYKARRYGETNISRFKHGWLLLKMTALALKRFKFI